MQFNGRRDRCKTTTENFLLLRFFPFWIILRKHFPSFNVFRTMLSSAEFVHCRFCFCSSYLKPFQNHTKCEQSQKVSGKEMESCGNFWAVGCAATTLVIPGELFWFFLPQILNFSVSAHSSSSVDPIFLLSLTFPGSGSQRLKTRRDPLREAKIT